MKKKYHFEGYEQLDREVKPLGNSAYVQAPLSWMKKKVSLVLLEPKDEKE